MPTHDASGMFFEECGTGLPVVLVHGALSDYRSWQKVVAGLAGRCRTVAVSLRSYYPERDWRPGISAESQVADLLTLLGTFDAKPVLVGHSRGGRLALEVAARGPGLLRALVLHEPGGQAEPGFHAGAPPPLLQATGPDIRPLVLEQARTGDAEGALRTYIDYGHGAGRWAALPDALQQILLANLHTLPMMIADVSVPLSRERARLIDVPTLLLAGSASPEIFGRTLDVLEQVVAGSRRIDLPGCDHFATWLAPEPFTRALDAFLAAL